jgi:hypothetical protein
MLELVFKYILKNNYQSYDIPFWFEAHCPSRIRPGSVLDFFALVHINSYSSSSSSIGHPPHNSASPIELRLRVGPRALSGKKKEVRVKGVLKSVRVSIAPKGNQLGVNK